MLMQRIMKVSNRGQVTVEVAILFGFVVAALVAMALYLQRGVQGGMKSNSDSIGTQFSATKAFESHSISTTAEDTTAVKSGQESVSCQDMAGTATCTAPAPVLP